MIRGSEPTHTFSTPVLAEQVESVEIAYRQGEVEIVKKTEDCEIKDYEVSVHLSQSDTFKFFNGVQSVSIQLRIKTLGGDVLMADKIVETVYPSLFNEEI